MHVSSAAYAPTRRAPGVQLSGGRRANERPWTPSWLVAYILAPRPRAQLQGAAAAAAPPARAHAMQYTRASPHPQHITAPRAYTTRRRRHLDRHARVPGPSPLRNVVYGYGYGETMPWHCRRTRDMSAAALNNAEAAQACGVLPRDETARSADIIALALRPREVLPVLESPAAPVRAAGEARSAIAHDQSHCAAATVASASCRYSRALRRQSVQQVKRALRSCTISHTARPPPWRRRRRTLALPRPPQASARAPLPTYRVPAGHPQCHRSPPASQASLRVPRPLDHSPARLPRASAYLVVYTSGATCSSVPRAPASQPALFPSSTPRRGNSVSAPRARAGTFSSISLQGCLAHCEPDGKRGGARTRSAEAHAMAANAERGGDRAGRG
ncbi:hypothetical protein GGX14DRAFT_609443 [Mycena pura]|uniref:Uncharacterized protein n=1 Tax=Mycena pura TaxID=153505 RepID=A0AAD6VJ99_9AGAR|nr:hypothetical protein GGX14DRAFT_609443 [Mycena pura]